VPRSGRGPATDDFVAAHEAQNAAGLFVQKIEIEIGVRETLGQIFHTSDLCVERIQPGLKRARFAFDLGAAEQAVIALYGGECEIKTKAERHGEIDQHTHCGPFSHAQLLCLLSCCASWRASLRQWHRH